MNGKTRRSRFEARVELERMFITPVNNKFGKIAPLAGMTADAIERWRETAAEGWSEANGVASILREASMRAELLTDNSKDVFEPERRPSRDSMIALRDMLNEALARV